MTDGHPPTYCPASRQEPVVRHVGTIYFLQVHTRDLNVFSHVQQCIIEPPSFMTGRSEVEEQSGHLLGLVNPRSEHFSQDGTTYSILYTGLSDEDANA